MGRGKISAVLLLLFLPTFFFLSNRLWQQRIEVRRNVEAGFILPSKFSRIMALDYKGLLSDYQLLQIITFYGGRVMYGQELSEDDWRYIIAGLESVTDLDPYFLDPYLLGEGLLTWEAGKLEEANRLLEKGAEYRSENWLFPFYIGFNYFYFLKDNAKGAEYLMKASRLPGSPSFLPTLAARLGYYGGQSKMAIVFLKGLLDQTSDPRLRNRLQKRLRVLERAATIEEAVRKFHETQGRMPANPQELVSKGYLKELPEEPYGGKWIILSNGRIFSTSKFVDKLPQKNEK